MNTYQGRSMTGAIIAVLEAASLRVGDGEKPDDAGWSDTAGESTFRGYVVVHPLNIGGIDGTLDAPSGDAWPYHQVTAFGETRAQAEMLADRVRTALTGTSLAVTGRGTGPVIWDGSLGTFRLDDVQPPIYQSVDRYTAFNTPG